VDVAEWAGVIAAVSAGIAAMTSLIVLVPNMRMIRIALRPLLHGVVVHGQSHPLLEIHNSGGCRCRRPALSVVFGRLCSAR
jgi:hypothetical protein